MLCRQQASRAAISEEDRQQLFRDSRDKETRRRQKDEVAALLEYHGETF